MFKDMRAENRKLIETTESYKKQVSSRDQEIARNKRLQHSRVPVFQKDSQFSQNAFDTNPSTVKSPELEINHSKLQSQLKDAQFQQHEAKLRAICLAERIHGIEHSSESVNTFMRELNILRDNLAIITAKMKMLEESTLEVKITNQEIILEKDSILQSLSELMAEKDRMKLQIIKLCSQSDEAFTNELKNNVGEKGLSEKTVSFNCKKTIGIQCELELFEDNTGNYQSYDNVSYNESPQCARQQQCVYQKMKAERDHYYNELKRFSDGLRSISQQSLNELQEIKHDLENKLRKCEFENTKLKENNQALLSELKILKSCSEHYDKTKVNVERRYHGKKWPLELLLEEKERTIKTINESKYILELELASAIERISALEKEKYTMEKEIESLEQDKQKNINNLHKLDQEKDNIICLLDVKTERCALLKNDLNTKEKKINEINSTLIKTQEKIRYMEASEVKTNQKLIKLDKEIERLKQENASVESYKDNLVRENMRLRESLTSVYNELQKVSFDLEKSKSEVEDLKTKLQNYVAEVQQVEEVLQKKENERINLLDNFRSLTVEACALETSNCSLGIETKTIKDELKCSESQLHSLEKMIAHKDNTIDNMESKIDSLSQQVLRLQDSLSVLTNESCQ